MALFFCIALPLQEVIRPWADWYPRIHPWLFGVFYVYALAGIALCAVGIYDGKRSAVLRIDREGVLCGGCSAYNGLRLPPPYPLPQLGQRG